MLAKNQSRRPRSLDGCGLWRFASTMLKTYCGVPGPRLD
jgi:hypothetical protein